MENNMEIHHVRLAPEQQISSHLHSCWELSYVISGHGSRSVGDTTEPFADGDLVLVPPGMSHCWTFSHGVPEIENITLIFSDSLLQELSESILPVSGVVASFRRNGCAMSFSGHTRDRIVELLMRLETESPSMRVVLLLALVVMMEESSQKSVVGARRKSVAEIRLERIAIFIACNYNRGIDIDAIAGHVGMNRSAVCSFYRKHTGMTLIANINRCRVEAAKNLLRFRTHSIQQVCYESGFNDVSYFCRLFRKMEGMTPGEFRRRNQPDKLSYGYDAVAGVESLVCDLEGEYKERRI